MGGRGPLPQPACHTCAVTTGGRHERAGLGVRRRRHLVPVAAFAVGVTLLSSCSGDPVASPSGPVQFTQTANAALTATPQAQVRYPPNCLFNEFISTGPGCEIERMSGGVAVGDFDNDGDDDLYVTRLDGPGTLVRNDDGNLVDATSGSGLDQLTDRSNGAGWADLDNDGDQDLVITTIDSPRYYLYMNDGDGTFTEEAVSRGAALADTGNRAGFSVAFGDINNDGFTDIHLTEWLNTYDTAETTDNPNHARMLRNRGTEAPGYFEDVTVAAGVDLAITTEATTGISNTTRPIYSFASAIADLDGDGWADLVVAGDYGTTQLFWNDGDGTFTEGTVPSGIGFRGNAMGLAVADVEGDGDLDVFITAIYGRSTICQGRVCQIDETGNRLFRNNGDRTFTQIQEGAGVVDGAWGWGAVPLDVNNDSLVDLAMTNGIRFDGDDESRVQSEPYTDTAKRLWLNQGDGTFSEVAEQSGFGVRIAGSGLAVLDLEGNGQLDMVMIHPTRTPTLWRNEGNADNGWVKVKVTGTDSNRDAIGAVVTVTPANGSRPQTQHVGINSHFLGQSSRTVHFGLGPRTSLPDGKIAEIRVRFPATGREIVLTDVPADGVVEINEPAG